jgi:diguanylate cyclase
MRYRHSTAQSAEYLRLALKRMAQQEAGLHPASYAIWYEYVAGINPALQAEIDALLIGNARSNDETTYTPLWPVRRGLRCENSPAHR